MAADVQRPVNSARTTFTPISDAKQTGEMYVPLPKGRDEEMLLSHARQTIGVDAQTLYTLWKDEASFPLWQEKVISVTPMAGGKSHWVMGDPHNLEEARLEFDSEITEDIPGEKIAWKSIAGQVEQQGNVTFKARKDGRGTVVTLEQEFKIGKLANAAASVAQRGPGQTVIENLRHFKQLAEAGEIPTERANPHGPRGLSGGIKKWMYGENNATPRGTSVLGPESDEAK